MFAVLTAVEAERIERVVITLLALLLIGLTSLLLGALLLIGLRIFQKVIGLVDLIHLLCGLRVAGVQIRMIFLCKTAIGLPDLVFGCTVRDAEHLIGVCDHVLHILSAFV